MQRRIGSLVTTLLVLLVARTVTFAGPATVRTAVVGDFTVSWTAEPLGLDVRPVGQATSISSAPPGVPWLTFGRATERVRSNLGAYHFEQDVEERAVAWSVLASEVTTAGLSLTASLRPLPPAAEKTPGKVLIRVAPAGDGTLHVTVAAPAPEWNRVRFTFRGARDEDFLGFGEQYNRIRHAHTRVPIWVSEQGIGRSDGRLRLPFTGTTTDSYFPLPYFLSTRGYGFLADTTARSVFEMRVGERPERIGVEIWDGRGGFYLFAGPRPADVVRRLTAVTGRPRMLPPWGFGVWISVQGGPGRIEQVLSRLEKAQARPDAVWSQDWLGARKHPFGYDIYYHWSEDPQLYPNLEQFISGLHSRSIKFLGYFNSFIEPQYPEFAEAAAKGWLVQTAAGKPYIQQISTFKAGLLDLSNPEACRYLGSFMRRAVRMGMDGWMADFGEWLPWDSKIHAPEGARLWHNRYPVDWVRLNRESCLAERPDGDFVVFNRSGYTGSVPNVDILWAGDQNTSWKASDGLPSVVPAGLNLGLSGVPFFHFDAGGYTSLVSLPRGQELFQRWIEAAALSPLLRTHEGYWRQLNVQVDSNPRVLEHFARMTRLHRWLQPKVVEAAREAVATGLPLMRHMWLAFPDDPSCLAVEDQYLLGAELLAAPVLAPGQKARPVYFPAGSSWVHWATGRRYDGPARVSVEAPLGTPALFVRAGVEMPQPPR